MDFIGEETGHRGEPAHTTDGRQDDWNSSLPFAIEQSPSFAPQSWFPAPPDTHAANKTGSERVGKPPKDTQQVRGRVKQQSWASEPALPPRGPVV